MLVNILMISKLAVILIGQFRTFKITNKYLFEFFSDKAQSVDYYFVTWPTSGGHNTRYFENIVNVVDQDITDCFHGQRLIDYRIVSDIAKKHTYYRMAYLAKIAQQLKKTKELSDNFVYDQVVETRPDVYLRSGGYWSHCEFGQYGGHPIELKNGHAFINDLYIRSDSATHDIIADRISEFDQDEIRRPNLADSNLYGHDHHTRLAAWLAKNKITHTQKKDYAFISVIRNQDLANSDLNQLSYNQLTGASYAYTETNPRPKFISVYHNVTPQEFTATHNIFIEAHGQSVVDSIKYSVAEISKIQTQNNETYDWVRFVQNSDDDPDQFFKIIGQVQKDQVYVFRNSFYCHRNLYLTFANLPESRLLEILNFAIIMA